MADTKVLRVRLEQQLHQIQERLRAIDVVEALDVEMGGNGSQPAVHGNAVKLPPVSHRTIMETCKVIALADPTKQWTAATMTPAVQSAGRADAGRANVTTSLRRLASKGALEIVAKNKKEGFVYRAKTAKAVS